MGTYSAPSSEKYKLAERAVLKETDGKRVKQGGREWTTNSNREEAKETTTKTVQGKAMGDAKGSNPIGDDEATRGDRRRRRTTAL